MLSSALISWATLYDAGTTVPGIVGKRRHRHQDEVIAVLQPPDDLGRRLAALVLAEEFFDVLNLERALLEGILRDAMFQRCLFF